MDELLAYFKTIKLPEVDVKINGYLTVAKEDPQKFIDSCKRSYANGRENGLLYLHQYKAAIEKLSQNRGTTPVSNTLDVL